MSSLIALQKAMVGLLKQSPSARAEFGARKYDGYHLLLIITHYSLLITHYLLLVSNLKSQIIMVLTNK